MPKLKLRPAVKSLHEAITYLNPVGPVSCIQEGKTASFREVEDLYSSFNESPNQDDLLATLSRSSTTSCFSPEPAESTTESHSIPKDLLTSHRFFFSPRTTKSIMEEVKAESTGPLKTQPPGSLAGSVPTAMASSDPYRDFRTSMEEMVEAHGVREWPQLQELLHCYLRLNDRRTHSIIVLAFMDVLMCLMAQDKDAFFSSFPSLSSSEP